MTVRQGRRYVRIFSPMSLLAIGMVACCAGFCALFAARLLPEEMLSREFSNASLWFGVYLLSIGLPAATGFATKVVERPREAHERGGPSFDSLLGLYIVTTSTAGFLAVGGWLLASNPEYFATGVALCLFGLLDALVLIPLYLFLRAERKAQ